MPLRSEARDSKPPADEGRSPESSTSRRLTSRTRISAACEACKKRKTKCSGEPLPCQLCQIQGTECVIDLSRDMRRREAMQQTIYDSKSHQDALNDLIDCVRGGNDEMVRSLRVFLQRDDVAKQELFDTIRTWAQATRSQETEQDGETNAPGRSDTTLSQPYHTPLDEARSGPSQSGSTSRQGSAADIEPDHFEYLGAVHRYLKMCTEPEGLHILNTLLKVRSVSEAIRVIPINSRNFASSVGHERIDPNLQSAAMDGDHTDGFWHPTAQPDMDSAYPMEDMSQTAWTMSTQVPWTLASQPQADHEQEVDGHPQDSSGYYGERPRTYPPRQ